MANAGHDEMPPRPECEFDFNLPHGIDAEEDGTLQQYATTERSNDEPTPDGFREDNNLDALSFDQPGNMQRPMNYDSQAMGFSDEESAGHQNDRSWKAEQARKPSPKSKKSPRRSNKGDTGDEASPKAKRPRQSLFGGLVEEAREPEMESNLNDQDIDMGVDMGAPEPSPDFRHRMSSLNLDQQEKNDTEEFQNAQDTRPFDLGLGLGSFEEDGMLATGSRAASEDSFMIPPDDQVSSTPSPAFIKSAHIYSPCTSCARTSIAQKPSPTSTRTRPVTTTRPRKRDLSPSSYKRRKR